MTLPPPLDKVPQGPLEGHGHELHGPLEHTRDKPLFLQPAEDLVSLGTVDAQGFGDPLSLLRAEPRQEQIHPNLVLGEIELAQCVFDAPQGFEVLCLFVRHPTVGRSVVNGEKFQV